jgi:hypothetical protein
MHAYTWYVWRKAPRSGPSLKVRIGKDELTAFLAALNLRAPRLLGGGIAPHAASGAA